MPSAYSIAGFEEPELINRLVFLSVLNPVFGIFESFFHQEVLSRYFASVDHVPIFPPGESCRSDSFLFTDFYSIHRLEQPRFSGERIVATAWFTVSGYVFLVTHAIFLSVSCFSFYIFSCAFSSLERYDSVSVICKYQLKSAPVTDKGTKESRLNQQDEWNLNFFNPEEVVRFLLIRKVLFIRETEEQTWLPGSG